LTWIYIAWTIVLCGAELTAALQGTEPGFVLDYRSPAFVRTAVLLTVFRAAERAMSRNQIPPCSVTSLAVELGAPAAVLRPIVEQLERAGILVESASDSGASPPGLFLARDPSELTLAEVFEPFELPLDDAHGDERIRSVLRGLATTERDVLSGVKVKDLVMGRFEQSAPLAHAAPAGHA
jgi:DNA-binding IscR family transcriptional regulator